MSLFSLEAQVSCLLVILGWTTVQAGDARFRWRDDFGSQSRIENAGWERQLTNRTYAGIM